MTDNRILTREEYSTGLRLSGVRKGSPEYHVLMEHDEALRQQLVALQSVNQTLARQLSGPVVLPWDAEAMGKQGGSHDSA